MISDPAKALWARIEKAEKERDELKARVAQLEREKSCAEHETRDAYFDLCAVLAWTFNGIGSASNVKRAARELLRLHDERKLSISHGLVVR